MRLSQEFISTNLSMAHVQFDLKPTKPKSTSLREEAKALFQQC